jgi:hypothetical protein
MAKQNRTIKLNHEGREEREEDFYQSLHLRALRILRG